MPKLTLVMVVARGAGVEYYSHPLTDSTGSDGVNWGPTALCLCPKCADLTHDFTTVSEFKTFKKLHKKS